MSIKIELQSNNIDLQNILDTINNLPEAGVGEAFAAISVTYPTGSTCTCVDSSETIIEAVSNSDDGTNGYALFLVPNAGTYTVNCTNGTDTASENVEITTEGQAVSVSLAYELWLFNNGDECTDTTGGWTSSGYNADRAGTVADDRIKIYGADSKNTFLGTTNLIDLSDFTELVVKANVLSTYGSYEALTVRLKSVKSYSSDIAWAANNGLGEQEIVLDVSEVDSAYVVLYAAGSSSYKSDVFEIYAK